MGRAARVLALAGFAAGCLAGRAAGQAPGTTGGVLLEFPATARIAALGGAYSAVVGDAGSVFVNPAGLAPIKRAALQVSYEPYLLRSSLVSAALAVRVGSFTVGGGVHVLDFGGDSVIVPDPLSGGDAGMATGATIGAWQALAVGALTYRRGLLSAGVGVKALREHVGPGDGPSLNSSAVAADIGLAAAFFDIAALGVVFQNIGGPAGGGGAASAPLPHTTRIGYTLNFIDPQGTGRLMTAVEWVAPPGSDSYWALGFEGGAVTAGVGVVVRTGFVAGRRRGARRSPVVGVGVVLRGLRFDWAFQEMGALAGGTHRVTAGWVW